MITYNSKSAVTVIKKNEEEFYVRMYSLKTYKQTFQLKIGGTS